LRILKRRASLVGGLSKIFIAKGKDAYNFL